MSELSQERVEPDGLKMRFRNVIISCEFVLVAIEAKSPLNVRVNVEPAVISLLLLGSSRYFSVLVKTVTATALLEYSAAE